MRTIVKGKNVEVPDRVREYTERKLHRLERLLDDRTDALVEFSNETHKSASDAHRAEVTLIVDGATLHSHATGGTYQAALDTVLRNMGSEARAEKKAMSTVLEQAFAKLRAARASLVDLETLTKEE